MKYLKEEQPEGNYYDKYHTSNSIEKKLMEGFFEAMDELIDESGIAELQRGTVLEAGCGEGNVTDHICKRISDVGEHIIYRGFDISEAIISEASASHPNVDFFVHNIYEPLETKEVFELIVCSEVLEHLEEPQQAICNLMNYGDKFIFSVPHEPIWRMMNFARGKYWRNLGNTPGHIQHFSMKKFAILIESCGLKIIRRKQPLPWLMVYCQKVDNK